MKTNREEMNMNEMSDADLDALFQLERSVTAQKGFAKEFAFETRVLARIREERETLSLWSFQRVAWKLMPVFAVAALALCVSVSVFAPSESGRNEVGSAGSDRAWFISDDGSGKSLWED